MADADASINDEANQRPDPEREGEPLTAAGEEEETHSYGTRGMQIPMTKIPGLLEMFGGASSSGAADKGDEEHAGAGEEAVGADAAAAAAVATTGNEEAGADSRPRHRDEREAASRKHIVNVLQHSLGKWVLHERKVYEKVKRDLPSRIASVLAESSTKQGLGDVDNAPSPSRALVAAAQELTDSLAVCGDPQTRPALKPLRATEAPPSGRPGKSFVVKDNLEREVDQWWTSTVDKVAARMCDSRDGRAFMDRCAGSLPQQDAEVSTVLAETLRPWRQQVELHLQAELGPQLAAASAEQLRAALRDGNDAATVFLEAAVNSAMQKAFASWADSNIRQAAQRLRVATASSAFRDLAVESATQAVRDTLKPLVAQECKGHGCCPPKKGHQGVLKRSLLSQIRLDTQSMEADLHRLTEEIEQTREQLEKSRLSLSKAEAMNAGLVGTNPSGLGQDSSETSAAALAAKRAFLQTSMESLCEEARFEEAFAQALDWDEVVAHPRRAPGKQGGSVAIALTEWLCDYVLTVHLAEQTGEEPSNPESFLTQEPEPLQNDGLKLSLMANLLSGCTLQNSSLERVEQNLEWVVSLQQELEATALVQPFFERNAGAMTSTLTDLIQSRSPPSLVAAGASPRQRVVRTARMISKQLDLLQRKLR